MVNILDCHVWAESAHPTWLRELQWSLRFRNCTSLHVSILRILLDEIF